MSLQLVDVNKQTVSKTWPLLLSAISSADFIALDLELSGLGWDQTKSAIDVAERYKLQCGVATSYGILSVGVACFHWQPTTEDKYKTPCKVKVFNIWLLSQHSYTIDPSSAKFLIDHGFDFNKQFRLGLPYTPVHASPQVELSGAVGHLPSLFGRIVSTGCPLVLHNGLIDLLFLYSHLYAPLPSHLDVFMADLSDLFSGGVYDTKAITELLLSQQASFLEYVFRKRQSDTTAVASSGSGPYLDLVFADYAALDSCVETVSIQPPATPPFEELLHIQPCHTFSRYGYCHRPGCSQSHDVMVVIALEEHKLEMAKAKRKRKKELQVQRKRQKMSSGEEVEDEVVKQGHTHEELADLFESELSAAKAKLSESQKGPVTDTTELKPSFGHRAGFDAFMTGYSFASTAVSSQSKSSETDKGCGWLSGVQHMRNKLANKSRGNFMPLQVIRSHFTNTSQAHNTALANINTFFKVHDNVITDPKL